MTTQATEGFETIVYDQLVTKLLKDNGTLSMSIGGLPSDANWDSVKVERHNGGNLKIVPNTFDTVKVLHGTIWDGAQALNHASDEIIGVGQAKTFPAVGVLGENPHQLYAVASAPNIDVQVLEGISPTTPPGSVKKIGMVNVASSFEGRKILNIITRPDMVNSIATQTVSIDRINYDGGSSSGRSTNAFLCTASFTIVGTSKVGEFSLSTGVALPNSHLPDPTSIIAYIALGTQLSVTDALLTVKWRLIIGEPDALT